jgi:predicted nucleotide-binding protein
MTAEFPKSSLEQAISLPNALERNGGQPLDAIDMATALGISPGSSTLRTLGSSSTAYGLTTGSYKTTFVMAPTGESIVRPQTPTERNEGILKAALNPPNFKKVYEYYKGKKYPEAQFMRNTLIREFSVAESQADAFIDVFTKNMEFAGLIRDTKGGKWLGADAGSAAVETNPDVKMEPIEALDDQEQPIETSETQHEEPLAPVRKRLPNKLFIGHGGNKAPLEQLTKTLRELGIPYVVAEDEPNSARPISQKVRETMEQCGAAILIFSADKEYFDADGNSVWKPSENVSHELGAASVMYDNRVIMFKESTVQLASNYRGIGYIEYEPGGLDAKTNELLRELIALKILRVSVDD